MATINHHAINRRRDAAVGEIHLRRLNRSFIASNRTLRLSGIRLLQLLRFFAHHASLIQRRIALRLGLHILQVRFVFRQLSYSLVESRLIRPRIDLQQQLTLAHILPFAEVHVEDLSAHAAVQCHGVVGSNGPQRSERHRDSLLLYQRHLHRNRLVGLRRRLVQKRLLLSAAALEPPDNDSSNDHQHR
jgi:hypothetical protein